MPATLDPSRLDPVAAMLVERIDNVRQDISELRVELGERVKDHETRIKTVEQDMPGLREARRWLVAIATFVVIGASGMIYDRFFPPFARTPTQISTPAVTSR